METKLFRWLIVSGGPLSIIAIEAGWWFAEVGRQPWILTRADACGRCCNNKWTCRYNVVLFAGLYIVLGIGSIVVLKTYV